MAPEPTEAEIEAAAKSLFDCDWLWPQRDGRFRDKYRAKAKAALEAAARVRANAARPEYTEAELQ